MATVTGLTAARMLEIEAASVVDGEVDASGHLILTKHDGSEIDAGNILIAVPDENIVHQLNPAGYSEATPPSSYPLGVSVLALNDTETTADWPLFAGKFYSIHSIAYPGSDVTQIAQRLHGSTTTPEKWIRSGNLASGWSQWGQGIPDSSVQGSAVIPGTLGGSRLATKTVTYDKISPFAITPEKLTVNGDVTNLIPDYAFIDSSWRAARLSGLPHSGSFITPAMFGTWAFAGAGAPHPAGTFKAVADVTTTDQKLTLTPPIPCVEGDIFSASFWVYGEGSANATCLLGFRWYYPDGSTSLSNGPSANSFGNPTSWTKISETEVVPPGAIAVIPHLEVPGASVPSGKWNAARPVFRRVLTGEDLSNSGSWQNITAQCTPVNGTTLHEIQVRKFGPVVSIWAQVQLGVAIANNTSGDIANTVLFVLPTAWRPSPGLLHIQHIGSNGGAGPLAGFATDPANGNVFITAVAPGTNLAIGFTFQISGTYWM